MRSRQEEEEEEGTGIKYEDEVYRCDLGRSDERARAARRCVYPAAPMS